ncbi:MAG: UDP-glucose 4-epimerase GalE [Silvanigrellales bacterium]|nr:UDP-glucose 4-epimerase GalE [Silvanigrellales bacterium]
MKVLVTGGAGYIGSTICSALEDRGHTPVVLDNLVSGKEAFVAGRPFYKGDVGDRILLRKLLNEHPDVGCTIHCAALIVVPDSVVRPFDYYTENVSKSMILFHELASLGYGRIVFSSTASLYDATKDFLVTETSPLKPGSPYARSKLMMEMVLEDFSKAYDLRGISLRYFNPIGADPKLRSGMQMREQTHVVPLLTDVALGKRKEFIITGTEWPTRDGSGIRDYIHVWDLAQAHVNALEKFESLFDDTSYRTINLGTGQGVTVKELVAAFERVWGKPLAKREAPPRAGDVAGAFANADTAWNTLGWKAEMSLESAIRDALRWGERRLSVLGYP